jgi:hypothetical protein
MPATPTYILLGQVTLVTTGSSVNFSNIPQIYGDLVVVANYVPSGYTQLRFNNVSSSSYSSVTMYGTGGSTGSNQYTATQVDTSNNVGDPTASNVNFIWQIMDYAHSGKNKLCLLRVNNAGTSGYVHAQVNKFNSNDPITTINLVQTGTWAAGSTFYLYGVHA